MSIKFELHLESLFKEALAGNQNSYRQFLSETTNFLRKILSKKVFDNSELEDVVQEILLSIHKARHTYDGARPLMPWLNSIISFRFKDYLRAHYAQNRNKKVPIDENFDIEDENYVTESVSDNEDINKAIEKLKDNQKSILKLMYYEELSVRQVAEKMGMTESAVKVSAHRSYKILRKKLNQKHYD